MALNAKNYAVLSARWLTGCISQEKKTGIIILDLMLPQIDGFKIIDELKADIETKTFQLL